MPIRPAPCRDPAPPLNRAIEPTLNRAFEPTPNRVIEPAIEPGATPSGRAVDAAPNARASGRMRGRAAAALLAWVALAPLTALAAPAADDADISQRGRWLTETGNLTIEIARCGEAWCGTPVAIHSNHAMAGPGSDMTPPDPGAVLGKPLLSALRPAGEGRLDGRIFNRQDGQTYGVILEPASAGRLVVRPYRAPGEFGPTQVWQRVAAEASPAREPASRP